jgi:hypothetical protein
VAKKEKEKADFVIEPTPVELRNFFKGEKVVIVRTLEGDKKIEMRLPKFDEDDFDELSNAHDYLSDILEDLDPEDEHDDDGDEEDIDIDDDDDDEELGEEEDEEP